MDQLYDFHGSIRSLIIEKSLFKRLGPFWKQNPRILFERREYDSQGRIGKIEKTDCMEFYAYLPNDQIAAYYQFDKKDTMIQHHVYYYKESGELESRDIFYRDDPVKKIEYEEDRRKGALLEREGNRIRGKQFDSKGRLASEYIYHGTEADYIIKYYYDEKGAPARKEHQTNRGQVVKTTYYKCNGEGLLLEEIERDRQEKTLYHKVFAYPGGDDKNWLIREEYALNSKRGKIPLSIIYRSLNFYNTPRLEPLTKKERLPSPEKEKPPASPPKKVLAFPDKPQKPEKKEGTLAFENGFYKGEILGETMEGVGVFTFNDGGVYSGPFVNGVMEGKGEFMREDGSLYTGDFKQGQMDGKGKLTWADGSCYKGPFREGLMDGVGLFTWPDGTRFKGLFERGKRTDQGLIEPPN